MENRARLLALNLIDGIGSTRLRRLLETFGSLERLWQAEAAELRQVEGIGAQLASRIVAARGFDKAVQQECALAQRGGARIVTLEDEDYPTMLRAIPDPPLVLYVRGTLPAQDTAVGIVGARLASLYGLQMAQRLGYDLGLRGITVVSGLARGVDGAAHRGALKSGSRTVAFLGGGLSRLYPPEHRELAEQIVRQGAVVSEYPMGMEPMAQNFPRRNRLISGLSLGVVIVEAAKRSGALITADCALEQGREVFAVPGKADAATAQGTNHLLKQGARLVTSVEDILEELGLEKTVHSPSSIVHGKEEKSDKETIQSPLMEEERVLLAQLVSDEPVELDTIVARTGVAASRCASVMLGLELKRLVKQLPGKQFVKWN